MIEIIPLTTKHIKRERDVVKVKCMTCKATFDSSGEDAVVDTLLQLHEWKHLIVPGGNFVLCKRCANAW